VRGHRGHDRSNRIDELGGVLLTKANSKAISTDSPEGRRAQVRIVITRTTSSAASSWKSPGPRAARRAQRLLPPRGPLPPLFRSGEGPLQSFFQGVKEGLVPPEFGESLDASFSEPNNLSKRAEHFPGKRSFELSLRGCEQLARVSWMCWWGCASQSFFCPREGENTPQTPPSRAAQHSRGDLGASKRPFELEEAPSRDPFEPLEDP
jgi:hypothetical protein